MNAGFLGGQGHEVALHGGLQGGDAGWALALEIVQEIPDEDAVAPGMAGHPFFAEVEVIDCGFAAEGSDGNGILAMSAIMSPMAPMKLV